MRVSERVNGQASGPVPTSGFLGILDHSALVLRDEGEMENEAQISASGKGLK